MPCRPLPPMPDLFSAAGFAEQSKDEAIAPGAMLLRGFALPFVEDILRALEMHAPAEQATSERLNHGHPLRRG